MAKAPKHGLAGVIAERHDPAVGPVATGEQLALIEGADPVAPQPAGGPGRRPGSRNRRTAEWASYLDGRYGSPLEALARVMALGPRGLAAELGCEPIEGFDRWLSATKELAPYLHQKLPTAVDVQGAGLVPVVVGLSAAGLVQVGVDPADTEGVMEIVIDQGVSEGDDEQSNGEGSNDDG